MTLSLLIYTTINQSSFYYRVNCTDIHIESCDELPGCFGIQCQYQLDNKTFEYFRVCYSDISLNCDVKYKENGSAMILIQDNFKLILLTVLILVSFLLFTIFIIAGLIMKHVYVMENPYGDHSLLPF